MFHDSKIAANFSLSQTSASYVIGEGLSPYFTRVIIVDLVKYGLSYAVHFDEMTTTQVKRQMDLMLKYWSSTHNEIWILFYAPLSLDMLKVTVSLKMYEQMHNDGIPVDKMATLVHSPLVKALNSMAKILINFAWIFIHYSSIMLLEVKILKNCKQKWKRIHTIFQQHTEVWWLSMGPSIKRILEQLEAVTHFVTELAKAAKNVPQSINYKRVYMMLGTKEKVVTKITL